MSEKVYGFAKISKRYTNAGQKALMTGVISLIILAVFIGAGIYQKGNMHGIFCIIPYFTMVISIVGAHVAKKNIRRTDVAGKYLVSGYRVCFISAIGHIVIYLVGILKIIL